MHAQIYINSKAAGEKTHRKEINKLRVIKSLSNQLLLVNY